MKTLFILILVIALGAIVWAQGPRPDDRRRSGPLPDAVVSISIENGFRVVRSNGLPDHEPGKFPRKGNPNSISPQNYEFKFTMEPKAAEAPRFGGGWFFAVSLNGVPFEPGTAEFWNGDRRWNYEALTGHMDLGIDEHNAHVQPTGAYHYHGLPTGLIEKLGGDGKKMLLLGYAADGFPVYSSYGHKDPMDLKSPLVAVKPSYRLKEGRRPSGSEGPGGSYDGKFGADFEYVQGSGDLDECNGRFGVTPEYPAGIYHYYITAEFPYISRSFKGEPDSSFSKRGMPPPGGGFGPPRGRRGGPGSSPPPPFPPE